ncbi:glutaredoxin domain-containing protein [Bacillus sp. AK031]
MNDYKITVYTQPDCPPCVYVKELLTHHNIPFIEKDIMKDNKARQELVEKYHAMSTPAVLINGKIHLSSELSKLPNLLGLNSM